MQAPPKPRLPIVPLILLVENPGIVLLVYRTLHYYTVDLGFSLIIRVFHTLDLYHVAKQQAKVFNSENFLIYGIGDCTEVYAY